MTRTTIDKVAALADLRKQLGTRVVTGSELLQVQETREVRSVTGMAGLNQQLGGGLPKGQMIEIIDSGKGGGGLVLVEMLAEARQSRNYVVWVDVGCGFSPEGLPEHDLESLLWVGCSSAKEAVEVLDTVSRDENFSLFLIDLRGSTPHDWRSVRASQWQRILAQLRQHKSSAVLFASEPVTSAAKSRVRVKAELSCRDLDENREQLWGRLRFSPVEKAVVSAPSQRTTEWQQVG